MNITSEVDRILRRLSGMEGRRINWESQWQDVADFVIPNKNNITKDQSKGNKRTEDLYDSTAIRSLEKLAAGLFGYITPPGEYFFKMASSIPQLNDNEEVNWYFSTVTRIITDAIFKSNYALEIHEDFLDAGAFGTSNMYVEEGKDSPINFKCIPIHDYFIEEGADGMIDTVYRQFKFTVRQAVQEWGEDNLSQKLRTIWREGKATQVDKEFTFIHAVEPNSDFKPGKLDKTKKRFKSTYVEKDAKHIISEGGYDENPYIVSRFMKSTNEIYGRSPSTNTLPEIKMLNQMRKTVIRSAEKQVDPPIFMPDDSVINRLKLDSGAINYVRGANYENKPYPFESKGNINIGDVMVKDEREVIREAYYSDLWDLLADKKNMTATEVMERVDNKLILFAPIFARLTSEKLSPMISRIYGIMSRMGLMPEPPEILREYPDYDIKYVSKVAMAIKMLDIDSTAQTLMMVQPYAQIDPTIMDNFNFNEITRGIAVRKGMPIEFINTPEQIEEIQGERAQAAQAQQQMDMISKGADAVTKLQGATDPTSPLAQMSEAPI